MIRDKSSQRIFGLFLSCNSLTHLQALFRTAQTQTPNSPLSSSFPIKTAFYVSSLCL
jgi:hypothetical protein